MGRFSPPASGFALNCRGRWGLKGLPLPVVHIPQSRKLFTLHFSTSSLTMKVIVALAIALAAHQAAAQADAAASPAPLLGDVVR